MLYLKFMSMPLILIVGIFWVMMITSYFTLVFGLMWMAGKPFTVRESGEVVGYIKWFKFYPKLDK